MSKVGHNYTYTSCVVIISVIKILSDIYLSCPLATWSSTIILQFDGALVILIDNIVMDLVSIFFQGVTGPDHLGQEIVHSNKISLS